MKEDIGHILPGEQRRRQSTTDMKGEIGHTSRRITEGREALISTNDANRVMGHDGIGRESVPMTQMGTVHAQARVKGLENEYQ